jgi:hypothetical protein
MSERRNNASSQESQPTVLAFHDGNQRAELIVKADLTLARYPAYVREQITDLMRVLAEKPGEAEKRRSIADLHWLWRLKSED